METRSANRKVIAIIGIAVVIIAIGAATFILRGSGTSPSANSDASASDAGQQVQGSADGADGASAGDAAQAAGTSGTDAAQAAASSAETNENINAVKGRPVLEKDPEKALSLWDDTSEAKKQLISYINAITDENSADFIPVEDRIAVFDMNGTLFNETDPDCFDYAMLVYRVTEDPEYKDKASEFEREVAQKIIDWNKTGKAADGITIDHSKALASAFKGMTLQQFHDYIREFKKQKMPNYDGMTRGDAFYQPMIQVYKLLKAHDFTIYVISGTDRFIMRGILDGSPIDVPASQIIGSDELVQASGQGQADGLNYSFTKDDDLVLAGEFLIKNLNMNKVAAIVREIGAKPVLSFGNSSGDAGMHEYTISNNPYRSLAFMLCCDDLARENGSVERADSMLQMSREHGWIPVSMKNDWNTIYSLGVTYLGGATDQVPANANGSAGDPANANSSAGDPANANGSAGAPAVADTKSGTGTNENGADLTGDPTGMEEESADSVEEPADQIEDGTQEDELEDAS